MLKMYFVCWLCLSIILLFCRTLNLRRIHDIWEAVWFLVGWNSCSLHFIRKGAHKSSLYIGTFDMEWRITQIYLSDIGFHWFYKEIEWIQSMTMKYSKKFIKRTNSIAMKDVICHSQVKIKQRHNSNVSG